LAVHYLVDKFCLLRNWGRAPMLGSKIAHLSRNYFFTVAVGVYAIMSSYNFASFPYDNACVVQGAESPYSGSFNATNGDGQAVEVNIDPSASVYEYCNQDMLRYKPYPAFPAVPRYQKKVWMSPEQESVTRVYGWTSIIILGVVAVIFLRIALTSVYHFFFGRKLVRLKLKYGHNKLVIHCIGGLL